MKAILNPREISISDFTYELPNNRIASFPMPDRDTSKLLVYNNGQITQSYYRQLAEYIPDNYLLIFNKTKVVEARLFFKKKTGGTIEIFCLEPDPSYPDISTAMNQNGSVKWICMVGGAAKWKSGQFLENSVSLNSETIKLSAAIIERNVDTFTILFEWTPKNLSFAEILHVFGVIPIPPYLNRQTENSDFERYQTIYAKLDGSVAAPTAGLHFTNKIFEDLRKKQIDTGFVTLHVGAGTFKPVKTEQMANHEMHGEFMVVERLTILTLLAAIPNIIAVGTTSLRTLESLYWMGVKAVRYPTKRIHELEIQQWEVYDELQDYSIPVIQSLNALLDRMDQYSTTSITCKTQIIITPGYSFKMVKGLITNFHQPQSTLLLLVAALIGSNWKNVYQYALENNFRFLSYGDGSLLWHQE